MAARLINLEMTRGDSQQFQGTLTPATGRTFSTPISGLKFTAKRKAAGSGVALQKTIGAGVAIVSQSSTAISYTIDFGPSDTSAFTDSKDLSLQYELELTEGNDWRSTPIGGMLTIFRDAG